MDVDPFWWKVIVMGFVIVAQGALWAWIGFRMAQIYSWWPIKVDDYSVVSSTVTGKLTADEETGDAPFVDARRPGETDQRVPAPPNDRSILSGTLDGS